MALHEQLSTLNRDARRARSLANVLWERVTGESTPDGVEAAASAIDGPLALQVDSLHGPLQDVVSILQATLDRLGPEPQDVAVPSGGISRSAFSTTRIEPIDGGPAAVVRY